MAGFFKDNPAVTADAYTQDALTSKNAAEAAKVAAEAAKVAAEAAKAAAETAEANTETAANGITADAATATTKAGESAASATQAATSAGQAASSNSAATASQTAAASSATSASSSASTATTKAGEASTAASNAATSETNAAASATTSATEATNSAASAASSLTAKNAAETAETNAETAETNAAASQSAAATSATNAAGSATTASTKAGEAATSATNAAGSATSAATSASTSTTQAGNASTSATSASSSASSAASAQSAAETAKTAAETAKTAAETAETNAETAETNAAASRSAAASSATSASNSATTATTQAGTSTTQAGNSATSATAASNSASSAASAQTAAEAARDSALAALDSFDDRYLGSKSSAPSQDNDGNALVSGALYFDSTSSAMKVYDGSNWLNAYASLSVGDGGLTQNNFTTALKNKLDGIESSADVTDTANVVGALTAGTNVTIASDGTISSAGGDPTGFSSSGDDVTISADADNNAGNSAIKFEIDGSEFARFSTQWDDGLIFGSTSIPTNGSIGGSELTLLRKGAYGVASISNAAPNAVFGKPSAQNDVIHIKSGTTDVGAIGIIQDNTLTNRGMYLRGGVSTETVIRLEASTQALTPATQSGGDYAARSSNSTDLGLSDARWKDFYLGNDISHRDSSGTARTLYDRSADTLGNSSTNVTAATVDGTNFKVNGGQGTDGQVLTSTGSGVAWEAPAGGGGSVWNVISSQTISSSVSSVTFTGVTGYKVYKLIMTDINQSSNVTADQIQLSSDNGSNFATFNISSIALRYNSGSTSQTFNNDFYQGNKLPLMYSFNEYNNNEKHHVEVTIFGLNDSSFTYTHSRLLSSWGWNVNDINVNETYARTHGSGGLASFNAFKVETMAGGTYDGGTFTLYGLSNS